MSYEIPFLIEQVGVARIPDFDAEHGVINLLQR